MEEQKFLLKINYECDAGGIGDNKWRPDEWAIYVGKDAPKLGDFGLGRNCYNFVSFQSCEMSDCYATGGFVSAVEPYTAERVKELNIDESEMIAIAKNHGKVLIKK